jgi:hypothetical protein
MTFIVPELLKTAFNCPHCGAYSKQRWRMFKFNGEIEHVEFTATPDVEKNEIKISVCEHCEKGTIWVTKSIVYPNGGMNTIPHPETPEQVSSIIKEASLIASNSPRGAAALLRLALQVLLTELGQEGKNINDDIGNLVRNGLPVPIQQALDVVRVIGNNAVHPGKIDTDNIETVQHLFHIINSIVEIMIATPNRTKKLYDGFPVSIIEGINQRDKKK